MGLVIRFGESICKSFEILGSSLGITSRLAFNIDMLIARS